ncbi:putative glutamate synthase (NADH) [Helianthus annuus]|nr:putative glutamate synthase (NADH) [Helianthus annuus]KAJ0793512.1 putative glutamate synthase (NADH) [Helianthus annuus]
MAFFLLKMVNCFKIRFRVSDQAIEMLVDCGCETNASDGVEILAGLPHDFYK